MTFGFVNQGARVALLLPYWQFWETSAGGPSFREERATLLESVAHLVAADGADVVWRGIADGDDDGTVAAVIRATQPDALVVVQTMATPPTHATSVLDRLGPNLPLVVWAAQVPLTLDAGFDADAITRFGATVGTPMLTNILQRRRRPYRLVVGSPSDDTTVADVHTLVHAARCARRIRGAVLARVGAPIPGYAAVDEDDRRLTDALGVDVRRIDPNELASRYAAADPRRVAEVEEQIRREHDVVVDDDTVRRSAALAVALEGLDDDFGVAFGTINCHVPQIRLSDDPGITPCYALGRETTRGIPWTCVGDVLTAVAMRVAKTLGGAALYHEIEAIDFETGEVALANSGEHDLRWCPAGERSRFGANPWFASDTRTGGSVWFELPPGPATLVGFTSHGEEPSGFRLVAAEGEITPRRFPDSPTVGGAFRFAGARGAGEAWAAWCWSGVNHHSAAAPGHLGAAVEAVAAFLGVGFVAV
jgi:L-arabinose isomerase